MNIRQHNLIETQTSGFSIEKSISFAAPKSLGSQRFAMCQPVDHLESLNYAGNVIWIPPDRSNL